MKLITLNVVALNLTTSRSRRRKTRGKKTHVNKVLVLILQIGGSSGGCVGVIMVPNSPHPPIEETEKKNC